MAADRETAATPPNEASEPAVEQQQPVDEAADLEDHGGMIENTGLDPQEEAEEAEKGHS